MRLLRLHHNGKLGRNVLGERYGGFVFANVLDVPAHLFSTPFVHQTRQFDRPLLLGQEFLLRRRIIAVLHNFGYLFRQRREDRLGMDRAKELSFRPRLAIQSQTKAVPLQELLERRRLLGFFLLPRRFGGSFLRDLLVGNDGGRRRGSQFVVEKGGRHEHHVAALSRAGYSFQHFHLNLFRGSGCGGFLFGETQLCGGGCGGWDKKQERRPCSEGSLHQEG